MTEYYTAAGAAKLMGVSQMTLTRWTNQGIISCKKSDGKNLYPKKKVEQLATILANTVPYHEAAKIARGQGHTDLDAATIEMIAKLGRQLKAVSSPFPGRDKMRIKRTDLATFLANRPKRR